MDIKYGGLRKQNLAHFRSTFKLSWAKRYLQSNSKWTIFPDEMDLRDAFKYGPVYLDRTRETTDNPFWLNVIYSMYQLQTALQAEKLSSHLHYGIAKFLKCQLTDSGMMRIYWWWQIFSTVCITFYPSWQSMSFITSKSIS